MSEGVIDDLKQFIAGAIAQQTFDIRQDIQNLRHDVQKLDARVGTLEGRVDTLETKVDDGFSAIAQMLEDMNTRHSAQETVVEGHGRRITRLEQKTAS